jgi:NTP pyrophosphatase (non-canonical NTP hydrolase)
MPVCNKLSSEIPIRLLIGPGHLASMAQSVPMPKRKQCSSQRVFVFHDDAAATRPIVLPPVPELRTEDVPSTTSVPFVRTGYDVVLSGSYRKDFEALKATYEELLDLGCSVLSPSSVNAVSEIDGFVYMKGEETQAPGQIESRHLDAIQRAQFIWLHAPEGYVGPTAALEVGFAHAIGVPVYASHPVDDRVISSFVDVVTAPSSAIALLETNAVPAPQPALKAFQEYYRRVATQRGYKSEGPKDCLLLMVEEVGELARAIRKREGLARHGSESSANERHELADVFLYVVHMANILDIDLSKIVKEKELINLQKFLHR